MIAFIGPLYESPKTKFVICIYRNTKNTHCSLGHERALIGIRARLELDKLCYRPVTKVDKVIGTFCQRVICDRLTYFLTKNYAPNLKITFTASISHCNLLFEIAFLIFAQIGDLMPKHVMGESGVATIV